MTCPQGMFCFQNPTILRNKLAYAVTIVEPLSASSRATEAPMHFIFRYAIDHGDQKEFFIASCLEFLDSPKHTLGRTGADLDAMT